MNTTPFNNLPLYTDGDAANLRDAYNESMKKIDKKLHQIDLQIQTLTIRKENNNA